MGFNINILDQKLPNNIELSDLENRALGVIQIGDFKEEFYVYLGYWSKADYKKYWKGAIERVLSAFRFTKQAKVFAKKYKDFDSVKLVGKIADRCEEIMYDRE